MSAPLPYVYPATLSRFENNRVFLLDIDLGMSLSFKARCVLDARHLSAQLPEMYVEKVLRANSASQKPVRVLIQSVKILTGGILLVNLWTDKNILINNLIGSKDEVSWASWT